MNGFKAGQSAQSSKAYYQSPLFGDNRDTAVKVTELSQPEVFRCSFCYSLQKTFAQKRTDASKIRNLSYRSSIMSHSSKHLGSETCMAPLLK